MSAEATRVALVGAGRMGREHARAFADLPGVTLAGIHSRTPARAEALAKEFHIAQVCESVEELYDRTRADLVVVSVPEISANAVAKACFRHPWTVLLEKPAGYNLADARDIEADARRRKARGYVALNRRYLSVTRQAIVGLGKNPDPRFIKVQDQEDLVKARALGHPEVVLKNWMFANGIHLVDYFRVFGRGAIRDVDPVTPWDPASPGLVVTRLAYDTGDVGLYEGLWNRPGPWAVTVTTPGCRWELRPLEQGVTQGVGQPSQPLPVDGVDQAFKPGFRAQAADAVAAAHGQSHHLPTLTDALATMELIARIYASKPTRQSTPAALLTASVAAV